MNRPPKRIVNVLAFLLAAALAPCVWASSEVLGVAYVPVQDPQTGEPVVMAVPFMNSEPGAVERALEFMGRPLHLAAVGPTTNQTDDVNLVSIHGIELEISVGRGDDLPIVTAILPGPRPETDETWQTILHALRDCVHRTAKHYGVHGCRFSVRVPTSDSVESVMDEHPMTQGERPD